MRLVAVMLIVLFLTLPFGFYRARTRRLSARWFLAIHLPVPLVFLARIEAHLPYTAIPFTCLAFFSGQLLGGKMARWRRGPSAAAEAGEAEAPEGRPAPETGVRGGGNGYARPEGKPRSVRGS